MFWEIVELLRGSVQFDRAFCLKPFFYRVERYFDFYVDGRFTCHFDLVLRLCTVGSLLILVNSVLFGTVVEGSLVVDWFVVGGLFPEFAGSGFVFLLEVCLFILVCYWLQYRRR